MLFLSIKVLHITSAFLLFGTGLGSAYYKFTADRSRQIEHIALTNKHVVLADWLFTTPTVIIQPVTGIMLAKMMHLPLTAPWIMISLLLYFIAGACWIPVVRLQIKMRNLSQHAFENRTPLPTKYYHYARIWFWLGVPAFIAISLVIILMVFKNSLF